MRRFLDYCLNRTPIIGLTVAALVFRALIPTGFMPVQNDSGSIVMELCSGVMTKTVHVHLDDAEPDRGTSHGGLHDLSPCGFAVATPGEAPPVSFTFHFPVWLQTPTANIRIPKTFTPSISRSQSPRAPPTLHIVNVAAYVQRLLESPCHEISSNRACHFGAGHAVMQRPSR